MSRIFRPHPHPSQAVLAARVVHVNNPSGLQKGTPLAYRSHYNTGIVGSRHTCGSPCSLGRAQPATASQTVDGKRFFDREYEGKMLHAMCKEKPSEFNLVLGPPSCGKTAMLKSYLDGKKHAVYMDCRFVDASNPTAFATALFELALPKVPRSKQMEVFNNLMKVAPWLALLLAAGKLSFKSSDGKESEEAIFGGVDLTKLLPVATGKPKSLAEIFPVFSDLLDAWEKEMRQAGDCDYSSPMLVIDEANVLTSWSDEYPRELAALLRFLVHITKQEQRCHVLLATSEYGYQAWLTRGLGPGGSWAPVVIGDFPEGQARMFLEMELQKRRSSISVDDTTWAKVYEMCGGNAGTLVRLASRVNMYGDWDKALAALVTAELDRIDSLALGREGYTAAQYAAAAVKLLDAKHHAIAMDDMLELLGHHVLGPAASRIDARVAGQPVLQCMVEVNALSMRPYSDWAQDIPAEAYGRQGAIVTPPSVMDLNIPAKASGRKGAIVTARSAMDLHCMRQLQQTFDMSLEPWKQQQKAAAATSGATTTSQTLSSSPEVLAVQRKMEKVEKEIQEAKEQGDKDELRQLREELRQLREELRQLREKELLLLRTNIQGN